QLVFEDARRRRGERTQLVEAVGGDLGVGAYAALGSQHTDLRNSGGDDRRRFSRRSRSKEFDDVGSRYGNAEVEAVEEGARQSPGVSSAGCGAAATPARRTAFAARARVHGADQEEPSREG